MRWVWTEKQIFECRLSVVLSPGEDRVRIVSAPVRNVDKARHRVGFAQVLDFFFKTLQTFKILFKKKLTIHWIVVC